ncbi:nitroreductase family protein [Sinisalibacter aestuarii]|uniref:Oxidoreductase n=1 Tax=Sinisalibacter aestuarii TaxID=2949426 RepID=A0ABQ5LWN6_9RHOB|nr:nitroreductase family protein [Sinisalibacter aestuarii]GKY88691.1 oxidoreductase [Sinisalibacter aestuarii]
MFSKDNLPHAPLPLPDRFDWPDEEMLARVTAFFELMTKRHSVRDFSRRPVPRAVIERAVATAGRAPSGANHQPWFFAAISDSGLKARIRAEAEAEEERFYEGGAGDEWLKALEPLGTDAAKPHLEDAPWLIVIFAQRWGEWDDGTRFKNYYVPESVGIATGFLIAALHQAGLSCLTHTPNPMKFLNATLGRPASEKPVMILAVGHPADNATVPAVAKMKKPLEDILTVFDGS